MPEAMAALYARAFPDGRAWSAEEIAALTAPPGFAVTAPAGFALGRAVAGEAELVTIAVDPPARRRGAGRALLDAFEATARARGAVTAFLEVAEDNPAARALYAATGWAETGRRKSYYARSTGAVDALTLSKSLA
ncbi:MAG: GNAT family N-acetyltransferase [Paracoccaceae bacterium]